MVYVEQTKYLTARQLELLKAITMGFCTKESLAEYLYVEKSTICSHLCKIYELLDVHTLSELVYHVLRNEELIKLAKGKRYRKSSYQEAS